MAVLNKRSGGKGVYIGRGSRWGNPFKIGVHGTRDEVCDRYRRHLWRQVQEGTVTLEDLAALDGRDLVCFCAPLRCHGHTLERAARWAAQQLEARR